MSSPAKPPSPGYRRVKVALLGLFGIDNFGNDWSLETMLRSLRCRTANDRLSVVCPNHEIVGRRFGVATFPMARVGQPGSRWRLIRFATALLLAIPRQTALWWRTFSYLRSVEQVVIPGTGALDDFGVSPLHLPYHTFRWCVCARLAKTPVAFVSVGAGPIRNRLSRWLMKSAAAAASYRSYRDHGSRRFMSSLGIDTTRDPIYPDLAFAFPLPVSAAPAPARGAALRVSVGPMSYHGWRADETKGAGVSAAYLDKLTAFIVWLLGEGHTVRLIAGDQADAAALKTVQGKILALPAGQFALERFVVEPMTCLDQVIRAVADTDIVVGSRFHNLICGLALGKPVISLSYAAKNQALLEEFGLGEYSQPIDSFDLALLRQHFHELQRDYRRHVDMILAKNQQLRESLSEQFDRLFSPDSLPLADAAGLR